MNALRKQEKKIYIAQLLCLLIPILSSVIYLLIVYIPVLLHLPEVFFQIQKVISLALVFIIPFIYYAGAFLLPLFSVFQFILKKKIILSILSIFISLFYIVIGFIFAVLIFGFKMY